MGKLKAQGRRQVACWLNYDAYQGLQSLIQIHPLRGIGETLRLLVENHQGTQEIPSMPDKHADHMRCAYRTTDGRQCPHKAISTIRVFLCGRLVEYGICDWYSHAMPTMEGEARVHTPQVGVGPGGFS